MSTPWDVFFAFIQVGLLLLLGRYLHQKIAWLQRLYLPESVVAGTIALLLGPEVLGNVASYLGHSSLYLSEGLFPEGIRFAWSQAPSILINIVFASLLLGENVANPKEIWQKAAPQIVFGQVIAWGQYVVGLGVTLLILVPFFQANPMAGVLIEISFEGGHSAAGAMTDTMATLGFPEGGDLALGMSTVGIVSGVVIGVALANWAQRQGIIESLETDLSEHPGDCSEAIRPQDMAAEQRLNELLENLQLDLLTLNFGFVSTAIALGWIILGALKQLEAITWGQSGFECIAYVPLFPMTLIGGLILQLILQRLNLDVLVMKPLINHISGLALDLIIVTAIASISLTGISQNLPTFFILSLAGIVWNIGILLALAPRLFPNYWFERGLGDFGQSMGVTATGLLLLRLVDPQNRSGALEAFAYKQLLFTPIVGGGVFSAAAPALIVQMGAENVLILVTLLLIFWLVVGIFLPKLNPS